MKMASVVLQVKPEFIGAVSESLRHIPGVELHGANVELGRIIATVEDGEGYAMTDSLLAVNLAPHVLGFTVAYEYTDEGLEIEDQPPEPMPGLSLGREAVAVGVQDKEA